MKNFEKQVQSLKDFVDTIHYDEEEGEDLSWENVLETEYDPDDNESEEFLEEQWTPLSNPGWASYSGSGGKRTEKIQETIPPEEMNHDTVDYPKKNIAKQAVGFSIQERLKDPFETNIIGKTAKEE